MRIQQLEQHQHVAEARVSPSPRTTGRYSKPKDRHTAWLESVNAVVTQNICAEGVALRWDRGAINAMQKDILLLFVARSVTLWILNAIKHMKSNVKGQNHVVAKPKVTEEDRLSVTSKVTEPNHGLKLVNRLRSSVWLTVQRRKTFCS